MEPLHGEAAHLTCRGLDAERAHLGALAVESIQALPAGRGLDPGRAHLGALAVESLGSGDLPLDLDGHGQPLGARLDRHRLGGHRANIGRGVGGAPPDPSTMRTIGPSVTPAASASSDA